VGTIKPEPGLTRYELEPSDQSALDYSTSCLCGADLAFNSNKRSKQRRQLRPTNLKIHTSRALLNIYDPYSTLHISFCFPAEQVGSSIDQGSVKGCEPASAIELEDYGRQLDPKENVSLSSPLG
jgi:hypothetical protein